MYMCTHNYMYITKDRYCYAVSVDMKRKINLSHKLKEYILEINYGQHEREMAEPSNNIAASMWWGNGTVTSLLIQN